MRPRFRPSLVLMLIVGALAGCTQNQPDWLKRKQSAPTDHWVTTDDSWSLHILRYAPTTIDPGREPVILCHGLSHNNTFWDLTDEISLAKYLQSQGYDVWSVSLRGCGQSTKPALANIKQLFRLNVSVFNPAGVINRQPGLLKANWTVD